MPIAPTDDEIVAAVQSGREQDYCLLVERYQDRLVRLIERMIQDRDEAMSLAQDTFIAVFRALPRYRPEGRFAPLLFRAGKNLTLNWLKRHRRVTLFSRLGQGDERTPCQIADDRPGPEQELTQTRQNARLDAALRRLPDNQRLALILKVYLEFSYERIGDITGWRTPKIESLIFRARKNLIGWLAQEPAGPDVVSQEMEE